MASMRKPKMKMNMENSGAELCEICRAEGAVSRCEGCGMPLCKRCRSMEIIGSRSLDISIKHFCPTCARNPEINISMGSSKMLRLEDITLMVNQDPPKTNKFKIKLKIS